MRIISSLFLVTVVANALEPPESYVENHLRGANTEDRDLQTSIGATSKSLAFSFASAAGAGDLCFDYNQYCLDWGYANIDTGAGAGASDNAFALAYSEQSLWLEAYCSVYAAAYAQVCAFTKADGDIKVDTKTANGKKTVSLSVALKTATTTFAMASSVATANAYTGIGAQSFTTVAAYCAQVKNMSPLCAGGTASTDLSQLAVANAGSLGQAFSTAASGSSTGSLAAVQASGSSLDYANGVILAYAKSWSFADAGAVASAFASALTDVSNNSFSAVCIAKHGEVCGQTDYAGKGICNSSPEEACASASATGSAWATAVADACVSAFAKAYADANILVILSANVNCSRTPVLSWTCTNAGVGTSCNA